MVDIPGTEAVVFNVFFCVCMCCLWRCMCVHVWRPKISLGCFSGTIFLIFFFFQIRFCTGIWGLPVRLGWLAVSPPEILMSLGYKAYVTTSLFYMPSRDWTLVFVYKDQLSHLFSLLLCFQQNPTKWTKKKAIFEVLGTSNLMTAEQRIGVSVLWDKIIHLSFVSLVPSLFFLFESISLFFP